MVVIHDLAWLNHRHDWPGLKAVAVVDSTREINGKTEKETGFYITSLTAPASFVGPAIRDHWSIENSLHRVMDMTFRDDECRVRTDHAPANLAVIRHMAHNLIRRAPGKRSLRIRRKVAGWDDGYLARVACRGRGRRSRLCRSHRRDLEGLRSTRAGIRQHQPPRRRRRNAFQTAQSIPQAGPRGSACFRVSFLTICILGGDGRRGDLPYNATSDSGVAYRLIQDCVPRSRRATLCA